VSDILLFSSPNPTGACLKQSALSSTSLLMRLFLLMSFCSSLLWSEYYKEKPQFHTYPDPGAARQTLKSIGPIGIGIELRKPAFTMILTGIQEGSPASKAQGLKKGQIIESINGVTLKDIDPRIILGNIITEAEASDGKITLRVKEGKGAATDVHVQIPVLGAYSKTWPVDCKKSDRIVREFADFLTKRDRANWGAALFLLSTGEEKDLDVVRRWFSGKLSPNRGGNTWDIGYQGVAICEYYLRTGDKSVIPAIESMAKWLKEKIYNGSWMGRGGASFGYMAGGHMNAAGVPATTFMLLARECGAEVDEHTFQSAFQHFFRYSGRGNVSYGDGIPEGGAVDNGRTGKLAFTMSVAAGQDPKGEASVYAKARDINATKSFYSTSWLFHGHTGGGIGELWRGSAMGLVKDSRPKAYRTFMDGRKWMYELARRHDGAFGWVSQWNVNYETTGHSSGRTWGNYIPLIYTLPRKHLRMFGAPKTKYSQNVTLPERPWGNQADDMFYSLEAGKTSEGKSVDIAGETLERDASMPLGARIGSADTSDKTLLLYAHHIEEMVRGSVAGYIIKHQRHHLIVPLLKSRDPRARWTGATTLTGGFKRGSLPPELITEEMAKLLGSMIEDPKESWWVVHQAMMSLGKGKAEWILPHTSRIMEWLKHDDWWLRRAAMMALAPIATHPEHYETILPAIAKMVSTNQRAVALGPVSGIVESLKTADPKIQEFGRKTLAKAYSDFPTSLYAPGGQNMSSAVGYMLDGIARNVAKAPGGFDVLYEVSRKRFPQDQMPHLSLFLGADIESFGPTLKKAFEPIIRDNIIWNYVGKNFSRLQSELSKGVPNRTTDDLIKLHRKIGNNEYDWKSWGPLRDDIEWHYMSYDPPEEKIWEKRGGRYRKVSWPAGSEQWNTKAFDADKAGWEKGFAPFVHHGGKLEAFGGCIERDHFCGCGHTPKTLWEKEVLLMRTELKLPPMKEGYAYRLLIGGRSHVGSGDGADVWINGKRWEGRRKTDPSIAGVGKRSGGKPWGIVFSENFREKFNGEAISIAISGFLPIHRSGVKRNAHVFWFEEMKLPTLGEAEAQNVLVVTPMMTSTWQKTLLKSDLYLHEGEFKTNPELTGNWELLGSTHDIPDAKNSSDLKKGIGKAIARRYSGLPFKNLSFKNDGRTQDPFIYYSKGFLVDIKTNAALKMTPKKIENSQFLFIEVGDFHPNSKDKWKPSYYVLEKKS
jgi:hypothetical protein